LAEAAVEFVPPDVVVGRLRPQIVEVHALAHGRSPRAPRQVEFGSATLPRHSGRDGFRFVAVVAPDGALAGFAYGYSGAAGQWWHDRVAAAMDDETRARWLDPPHFEFCEIAVLPELQGQGLGGRLHDALLAGRPEPRALLSTERNGNDDVLGFYDRRGWRVVLPEIRFGAEYPPYCVLGRELERAS
jgi:ribosomal protein S18 acetylase RimI-like enzyme